MVSKCEGDKPLCREGECGCVNDVCPERLATTKGIAARLALSGPYRFYDWDWIGVAGARVYDWALAPVAQFAAQSMLGIGAVLHGGNFAVRRTALEAIGGFDTSIEFHGEDTNLGRRLTAVGTVDLNNHCYIYTSARRYKALGRAKVFRLYVRNFWWETVHHRPKDVVHEDIRL
jgi:GT2 family glycosyltransferase